MLKSTLWLAALSAMVVGGPALAQNVMTDDAQMTLYTFDKDMDGKSSCYDDCATNWPPYLGKAGETKDAEWALSERTDGAMQWTYNGKPTYFYYEDAKAGDMMGEGKGGVWHTIKE